MPCSHTLKDTNNPFWTAYEQIIMQIETKQEKSRRKRSALLQTEEGHTKFKSQQQESNLKA